MTRSRVVSVLIAISIVCATANCASIGSRTPSTEFVGGTALEAGPAITSLPARARFAWETPTRAILRAKPWDEARFSDGDIVGLRAKVGMMLRANQWDEVVAGDVDYLITLTRIDRPGPRTGALFASTPDSARSLRRCTGANGEKRGVNCSTRPVDIRRTDGARVNSRNGSWLVLVIRGRDGSLWSESRQIDGNWIPGDIDFAPTILDLLLANRR